MECPKIADVSNMCGWEVEVLWKMKFRAGRRASYASIPYA